MEEQAWVRDSSECHLLETCFLPPLRGAKFGGGASGAVSVSALKP